MKTYGGTGRLACRLLTATRVWKRVRLRAVDFTRPQSSHSFFCLSPARSGGDDGADRGRSRLLEAARGCTRVDVETGKNLPARGSPPPSSFSYPDSFTARTGSTDRMRPNGHVKSRVRARLIIHRSPMGPLNQSRWEFIGRYSERNREI